MRNVIALVPTDGINHPLLGYIEEKLSNLHRNGVPLSLRERRDVLAIVRPLFALAADVDLDFYIGYFTEANKANSQHEVRELLGRAHFTVLHEWIKARANDVYKRSDHCDWTHVAAYTQGAEIVAVMIIVPDMIDHLPPALPMSG